MTYYQLLSLWRDTAATLSVVGQVVVKPAGTLTLENVQPILFPLVHIELESAANASDFAETYSLGFVVLDQAKESYADELQIMAKAKWIGENIINKVQESHPEIFPEPNTWSVVPIVRDYTEHLHGWRFEVNLQLQRTRLCEYPDFTVEPQPQEPVEIILVGGSPTDVTTVLLQSISI